MDVKYLNICDEIVDGEEFAKDSDDALVFECAVNALYVLTSGTAIPRVTTNDNTIDFIHNYKTICSEWGVYNGGFVRFTTN